MIYRLGERELESESGEFWVADNATLIGSVVLGKNASVWFGAVIRADNDYITIGDDSNIQDNAVLHVDMGVPMHIGKGVTVGHQAMLHGCTVGDNTLIGIQAVVLNKANIGKNCIIGAHALVPEGMTIPDNSLVVGVPAKVVREIRPEQAAMLPLSAQHYVAHSQHFSHELEVDDRYAK